MTLAHDTFLAPHEGRQTPFLLCPDGTNARHREVLDLAATGDQFARFRLPRNTTGKVRKPDRPLRAGIVA